MRKRIVIAILIGAASPVMALDKEIADHPNAELVAFYEENFSEVEALRASLGENGEAASRIAAFEELSLKYPLAAEISARELVSHPDTELAIAGIRFLKLNTVMSDHDMQAGTGNVSAGNVSAGPMSPELSYAMAKHENSRAALRAGVPDQRPEIRLETASYLASLSDSVALQAIQELTGELYSDVEAANLFVLASGKSGEDLLSQYLGSGSEEAQQTAVAYLGAMPRFQDEIRSTYFLNPDAPLEARNVAAQVLGTYDTNFAKYALAVTGPEDSPAEFICAALDGYLTALTANGDAVDPAIARAIADLVPKDIANLSEFDQTRIKRLRDRLDAITANYPNLE